ncbi:MAG TPA: polysaccharide deacetylase family protein [Burkholderiales bacterium]
MKRLLAVASLCALAGCAELPILAPPTLPIRFVLTFDDGPAIASFTDDRPSTVRVLETLADNPVQPGIKAIFFVQTRAWNAGGTEAGRALLRREHAEGHLLAVHTGTAEGHVVHTRLAGEVLAQTLVHAMEDIQAIAGQAPAIVRPPMWWYDNRTLAAYDEAGLAMLLTDLNAFDGNVYINFSLRKRSNLREQLARVQRRAALGELPALEGAIPVVATFHDVNSHTARSLTEYLTILVEEARALGLRLAPKPFYDRRADLERAARLRAFQTPRRDLTARYNSALNPSPDLP